MKRAAEKQLVKDAADDDDDDGQGEEVSKTGFKKADESVLAGRQIRGLPRRVGASSNAAGAPAARVAVTESVPPSKFAGFSGFGTSTSTPTPFSFASASSAPAPPAAPKLTPAVPATSPFSFPSSSPSQPSLFGGASVSSSASPATKAFASIVGSSSMEPVSAPLSTEDDQKEIDYYKALRGLNISFLSAVSKAIESDPFVDVADLLERYKALRVSVKSGFDEKSKSTAKAPSGPSFTESKPADAPKPAPTFSMPVPPASYVGFKPLAASSPAISSAPTGVGFVPKIDSSSSGSSLGSPFSFGTSKPAAESSTASDPKSAFSFGSTTGPAMSSAGPSFAFGGPSSSSSTSIFGSRAPASTSSTSLFAPSTSSTSVFGTSSSSSSIFGSGSAFGSKPLAADSSNDADDEKEKDSRKDAGRDKDDKKPAPFTFSAPASGASTPFGAGTPSAGTGTGATTPEKDKDRANPFVFGSASPGKPSLFSAFGTAKAGSIGNPVGFGFGSPPRTPDPNADADAADSGGPVKALPFSFGAPKTSAFAFGAGAASSSTSGSAFGSGDDKKEGSSGEGTPAPGEDAPAQPAPLIASSSVHDLEGEGEEDEETMHEIRSKVFKLTKDKEGNGQWGDLGVGMLRLKRHKTTDARRVLLRNSGTGKITINFLMHLGMKPTVSDKVVSFMGHSEGASTPYRIRCKTADQAKELKAALDRELDLVKNKGS